MCKFDVQNSTSTHNSNSNSIPLSDISGIYNNVDSSVFREADNTRSIWTIQHVAQRFQWDCGLACALMVLRAINNNEIITLTTLQTIIGTTSIWTIDLAHCLQRCGVTHQIFTTTCIGANPQHANERFYANQINQDVERVNRLFRDAHKSNIQIINTSLAADQLQSIISSSKFLVIALVDKGILISRRHRLHGMTVVKETLKMTSPVINGHHPSYTGHYIVLYGFDPVQKEYFVKDPADICLERISVDDLEAARKAYGTDEDLLLIPVTKNELSS